MKPDMTVIDNNKISCAVKVVLFLYIIDKASTTKEIALGIRMAEPCVEIVLNQLEKAHIVIADSGVDGNVNIERECTYQLQRGKDQITVADIKRIMDDKEKNDKSSRKKTQAYA